MVEGVGGKVTHVVGKLVDVPISLGREQAPGTSVRATFYVLDCQRYHWILGLTLLSAVDGVVRCRTRTLAFTLAAAGGGAQHTLELATRTEACMEPVYELYRQRTSPIAP